MEVKMKEREEEAWVGGVQVRPPEEMERRNLVV